MRARSTVNWLSHPKLKATWLAVAAGSLAGLAVLGACSDAPVSRVAAPKPLPISGPRFAGILGANHHVIKVCVDPLSPAGTYTFAITENTVVANQAWPEKATGPNSSDGDLSAYNIDQPNGQGPWRTGTDNDQITNPLNITLPGPNCLNALLRYDSCTPTGATDCDTNPFSHVGNRLLDYQPPNQAQVVNPHNTVNIQATIPAGYTYSVKCITDDINLPFTGWNTASTADDCNNTTPLVANPVYVSENIFHGAQVTYLFTAGQTGPCPLPNAVFGLGAAAPFTFLGLAGNNIDVGSSATYVLGNFGLGPNNTGVMKKATIDGDLTKDPTSSVAISSDLKVLGSVINASLVSASNDATAASAALDALAANQTFGNITGSQTFTTAGGTKVIDIASVNVIGKTFTIVGDADDVFIFNVAGAFSFRSSQMVLSGGVTPMNIIWNFTGGTGDVAVKDPSTRGFGIFLAPDRNFTGDKATIVGAVMVGQTVILHSGTQLLCE